MPDRSKFTYPMLLERIKKATGPDRKLDNLISWHLEDTKWWVAEWGERQDTRSPPRFTESIDATIAFIKRVLPGWDIVMEIRQSYIWAVVACMTPASSGLVAVNSANTPTMPLSLLEATVEALIKKQKYDLWKAKKNPPDLTG